MKLVVLAILLATGLVQADDASVKRGVLRRSSRQAIGSIVGSFLKSWEINIIRNCKKNGLSSSGSDELQKTFDRMVSCMGHNKVYKVPKDEFIDKMETCSRDAIAEVKSCLKPQQRYYPDFVLSLLKSLANFMYNEKEELTSSEVTVCIRNLQKLDVLYDYMKCLIATSEATHDEENIPNDESVFCDRFLPATKCFPKTLKRHCIDNPKVTKFFKDYVHANETPCRTKGYITNADETKRL